MTSFVNTLPPELISSKFLDITFEPYFKPRHNFLHEVAAEWRMPLYPWCALNVAYMFLNNPLYSTT